MDIYGLVGMGGFGREVIPMAHSYLAATNRPNNYELVFVVENLENETVINGYRVISDKVFLSCNADQKYFNIAIADSKVRERIANKMMSSGIIPFPIIASNNIIYDNNTIGEGAIFCGFTMVTSNVKIGCFFHANIYSYIAHDCVIGDFVTFAPNVHCNGRVVIEDHAYVGTGAIIKQGNDDRPIIIGKGCTVGMGAVVTKSVRPFSTVIGNPAAELIRTTQPDRRQRHP